MTQQHRQHFSFPHFQITGNGIGAEGGKAIGEALKANTSLTQLNLWVIQQHQHFSFSHFKSQRMKLEMMEGEPLLRHSRQTLHSLNLILE